jgi:hypothetical protein
VPVTDLCVLDMALAGKERKEKTVTEKPVIARTTYDLQRLKLEKLMKNMVCNLNVFHFLMSIIISK